MGLIVEDPGFFTTVQDTGRPGYREWGVPLGGAFDRASADLANALLGNPLTGALLELTLRGGVYLAACPLALAMAGAPMEAKVVGSKAAERVVWIPSSFSIEEGEQLILGRTLAGARTYLAVRGRMANSSAPGEPFFGTAHPRRRFTPCRAGNHPDSPPKRLDLGYHRPQSRFASSMVPTAGEIPGLMIRSGPIAGFASARRAIAWGCASKAIRVKIVGAAERLSAPVAPGAVQLAGGHLIILGVACGTMGGYPHIAHVISADLHRLGQLKPGDLLGFQQVTLDEARFLDKEARTRCQARTKRFALIARDA